VKKKPKDKFGKIGFVFAEFISGFPREEKNFVLGLLFPQDHKPQNCESIHLYSIKLSVLHYILKKSPSQLIN